MAYVEVIRPRQKLLATKTMFKLPAGADAHQVALTLSQHVRVSDSGHQGIIVDTARASKAWFTRRLVRRYTKVIDNQVVTVDFSGDGTWTYDVRPQTQP